MRRCARRQRVAELEGEAAALQREALDARADLQRQQGEHEAAQTAAAARITGSCVRFASCALRC